MQSTAWPEPSFPPPFALCLLAEYFGDEELGMSKCTRDQEDMMRFDRDGDVVEDVHTVAGVEYLRTRARFATRRVCGIDLTK